LASDWPLIVGAVLLALLATTLLRGRSYLALSVTTISIALAVAIVNWLRMRHYLSEHPRFFYPTRELWIDAAWYAVYLAIIAAATHGVTRLRWPLAVQVAAAVGIAVLLPPGATVTMLFVGCYFFAACP
jgi:integral membrane sensor domain MASE1